MKKTVRIVFHILFGLAAIGAIYEYLFVSGMFTAPIMFLLLLVIGLGNAIWSCIEKKWMTAYLYSLATIGFCLGYFKLLFFL